MAVLVKRKKSNTAAYGLHSWAVLLENPALLAASLLSLALFVTMLGSESGAWLAGAPSTTPPQVAGLQQKSGAPSGSAFEVAAVQAQASRLTAALLAFKSAESKLPTSLSELSSEYLSGPAVETKALLTAWQLKGHTLIKKGLSEAACRSITASGTPSSLDHGATGLTCVAEQVNEVTDKPKAFQAVYRIDPEKALNLGFWKIELAGVFANKLTTWKLTAAPTLQEKCEGVAALNESVELSAANPKKQFTVCLPAYEPELIGIKKGLSLLDGQDVLTVKGMAKELPWTLSVVAKGCDFGNRVLSQVELSRAHQDPKLGAVSCDLKPVRQRV